MKHIIRRIKAFLRPRLSDELAEELVEAWCLRERRHEFVGKLATMLGQTIEIVDGMLVIRITSENILGIR